MLSTRYEQNECEQEVTMFTKNMADLLRLTACYSTMVVVAVNAASESNTATPANTGNATGATTEQCGGTSCFGENDAHDSNKNKENSSLLDIIVEAGIYASVACFVTLPLVLFWCMSCSFKQRRTRQHEEHPAQLTAAMNASEQRQLMAEELLVSKHVLPHDGICQRMHVVRDNNDHGCIKIPNTMNNTQTDRMSTDVEMGSKSIQQLRSTDTEENALECPICMNSLVPGQIVSWSASCSCGQPFHHACLKAWLRKKFDACPCCRATILPSTPDDSCLYATLYAAKQEQHCSYFFCEQHGKVRDVVTKMVNTDASDCSDAGEEATTACGARCRECPTAAELMRLRVYEADKGTEHVARDESETDAET